MKVRIASLITSFVLSLMVSPHLSAQPKPEPYTVGLDYYMPAQWDYQLDERITTPQAYLGFQLGSQHVDWSQTVSYLQLLAGQSERLVLDTLGQTYEHRPIVSLRITSPHNHHDIKRIQAEHLTVREGHLENGPVVVCLASSVHGNEPSGVQASILVAYFMAAARGEQIEHLLDECVILLIPGMNPDGINRFASWVNSSRNLSNTGDVLSREFSEAWPSSRFNHYWHDCNRDWLFLEHPETRGAVALYHQWLPHLMSDHHEMGSEKTFFFSPGNPLRVSPYMPPQNQEMAAQMASHIKDALDRLGSKYVTGRGYDDYYVGKGASYGDVQGTVSLLCEQASARGHWRQTSRGVLTFPFAIRNQAASQFAIINAAWHEKDTLQHYMAEFYTHMPHQQDDLGILFAESPSRAVTWHFLTMLQHHDIRVCRITSGLKKKEMQAATHYFIPFRGNNPALVKSIMEANHSHFADSVFYDITAWTLPLAYNIQSRTIDARHLTLVDVAPEQPFPEGRIEAPCLSGYFTFNTTEFYTPAFIYALQEAGTRIWADSLGTLYVKADAATLERQARRTAVDLHALPLPPDTTRLRPVRHPRTAILCTTQSNPTTLGTYWFLLDYRQQMQPTLLNFAEAQKSRLKAYNTIILSTHIPKSDERAALLAQWVEDGGTLICTGSASSTLRDLAMPSLSPLQRQKNDSLSSKSGFPGGILEIRLQNSSPLCWGVKAESLPVFKNTTTAFQPDSMALYTFSPEPLSGYFAPSFINGMGGTPAVLTAKRGKGRIICFNFSVAFRSCFYGTIPLLTNAILFSDQW
ncbi:MAG: hypothetical protein K5945_10450 [Bacteroidaceae bacterium]|nr:hypothetical protein [Bacteroidaceae bacterium]